VIGVVVVVFISDACAFLDRKGYTLERVCAVWNLDETKSVAASRDWNIYREARAAVLIYICESSRVPNQGLQLNSIVTCSADFLELNDCLLPSL
jgi:hypothetical protein